jgi:hypothetical protein
MFKNIMKLCCYFWNNAIVNNSREQRFTINNIHIPTLIIDNSSSRKVRNFTYVARSNIQPCNAFRFQRHWTYWVIQNDCGQVWQLCTKIYVATVWVG